MKGYRAVGVPMPVVNQLMAAETSWNFPWLEGIVELPTMKLDGGILERPGYDEETALFYDSRSLPDIPRVVASPTSANALASLAVLDDVIVEFAFADEDESIPPMQTYSCAAMQALMLTTVIRPALSMCPVFLVDAPGQSNGKTLLADVVGVMATGRGAGATQWSGDAAEQRKAITSILAAGDAVINFDNVTAPIGGPAICGVTTAQEGFKDRLLGSTKMLDLPTRVIWMYTGNQLVVKDDMATRVLRIRLDARCERPDLRIFKRGDLLGYVKANRGRLIHAALTILRAYLVAGKPRVSITGKSFKIASRFNEWSDLIAGALMWLDRPDPLGSQQSVVAEEPVREARQTIMREWAAAFGDRWMTAKEIMRDGDGPEPVGDKVREALDDIEAGGTSRGALAAKLKTFEGLIIDGLKIVRRPGGPNQPTAWQLVRVTGPNPWD